MFTGVFGACLKITDIIEHCLHCRNDEQKYKWICFFFLFSFFFSQELFCKIDADWIKIIFIISKTHCEVIGHSLNIDV